MARGSARAFRSKPGNCLVDWPVENHGAMLQHNPTVTNPGDQLEVVAHHHESLPGGSQVLDLVQALSLERLVSDGEDLVDEKYLGVRVDGHRKSQTQVHTRGVEPHFGIDKLTNFGEVNDGIELLVDLRLG